MQIINITLLFIIFNLVSCDNNSNNNSAVEKILRYAIETKVSGGECEQQMNYFLWNLLNMSTTSDPWAFTMIDSSTKILQSGYLSLSFTDMGNFDECLKIDSQEDNVKILGKYCLGYFSDATIVTRDPKEMARDIMQGRLRENIRRNVLGFTENDAHGLPPYLPTFALCIPHHCSVQEFVARDGGFINITFPRAFCQTKEDANPSLNASAIITISIFSMIGLIMVLSTGYDYYCERMDQEPRHTIFIAFSAYTNSSKLLKMSHLGSDQLPCLNGIRFLSMLWVIVGHTASVYTSGAPVANPLDILNWSQELRSMIIVSGTLSVDTFFVVGGALLMLTFWKAKEEKTKFNLPLFYFHRYLRLTPPLAATVLASATILKYLGSGPFWPTIILNFQENCQKYWWTTVLYVQNYVNTSEMCVGQTWYLNIDMQMYILSPIFLWYIWSYPKQGLALSILAIIGIMIGCFYISWDYELPAIMSNIYAPGSADYMTKYYLLTHTRAGPWFIGLLLGYLISQAKYKNIQVNLNNFVILLLWTISLATLLACIFGGHSTLRGVEYEKWGNAFHITLVRPSWAFSVAIIIFLCVTNNGGIVNWFLSFPIFQVLNRFTYSMYLLHVTMLYIIANSTKVPLYFSEFQVAYSFWGLFMFSFILSYFWVLAFESPIIVIEGLILRKKKAKPDRV